MPDLTLTSRLRGLILSAAELQQITEWPDALIEDYLTLFENFTLLAGVVADLLSPEDVLGTENQVVVTINADRTITLSLPQDIDTGADVEFDSIILDDLTALRLVSSNASKKLVSIATLASWIAGTANEITVTDDGAGGVTVSIPLTFILKAGTIDKAPMQLQSGPLKTVPVPGSLEFLTDKFFATQTTGTTRKEIKLVDQYYAEMFVYENAVATTIGNQNVYHAIVALVTGLLSGFTFMAGLSGSGTITDYSGTVAGTVLMTDAAHGLLTGDIVTQHNSTNYNGTFEITKVTDDTYYIIAAYTSDQATDWAMGSYLLCGAGSDGVYRASMNNTAFGSNPNEVFKFELNINLDAADNIASSRKFGGVSDYGAMGSAGLISLSEDDRVWMSVKNETSGADVTIRHSNVNLTRC
jgi:hypothetical protein